MKLAGDEMRERLTILVMVDNIGDNITATTAPDDGTQHPQLQPALSSAGSGES